MKYVWLNGALQELSQARISPVDHGLVTGDGLFETLAAYEGKAFALTRHIERLKKSALGMYMPTDVIEKTNWKKAIDEALRYVTPVNQFSPIPTKALIQSI